MPDEKPPDLKASLIDAWEAMRDLGETVNDLVLQPSATLIALAKTLPSFALEYDQAYSVPYPSKKNVKAKKLPTFGQELHRLRGDRT